MEIKSDDTLLLYEVLHRGLFTLYQQSEEQQQKRCAFLAGMCRTLLFHLAKVQLQEEVWPSVGLQWRSRVPKAAQQWLDHAFTHYKQQRAFAEAPGDAIQDLSDLPVTEQRSWLHWLLFFALLEIRIEAHDAQHWEIFSLADTFHHLPLQLASPIQGFVMSDGERYPLIEKHHINVPFLATNRCVKRTRFHPASELLPAFFSRTKPFWDSS